MLSSPSRLICSPLHFSSLFFLFLLFLFSLPQPSAQAKSKGSFYSLLKPFEGYEYTFISSQTTWQEAGNLCKALYKANLATVDTPAALNFLIKWLAASYIETAWVGGIKNPNATLEEPRSHYFIWKDSRKEIEPFVWAVGQPVSKPTIEDFLREKNSILMDDNNRVLICSKAGGGKNEPGGQLHGAICRAKLPPTTTTTTPQPKDDDD